MSVPAKTTETGYEDPQVSIDGQSKSYAIFDGFTIVRKFQSYTTVAGAIEEATEWLKSRSSRSPKVIYPVVRSFRVFNARAQRH